jgi:hypothetical protein
MITEIKSPDKTTYWIAHSKDGSICHYGVIDKGLYLATGQPTVKKFTDEKAYLEALGKWKDVEDTDFKLALASEVAWVKSVASKQSKVKAGRHNNTFSSERI